MQPLPTDPARFASLRGLCVATLVLCGGRSPATTRRICQGLAARLPDARLQTVPGAGHMLPITHREVVHDTLVAHPGRAGVPSLAAAA